MTLHSRAVTQPINASVDRSRPDEPHQDYAANGESCELPADLVPWCYLLGSMPSGWDVTPPFYPELGGSWTVVGFNTRRQGPSTLPSFLVGRGDEPTPAVIDLANQFVAWSEQDERSAPLGR